jgi:pyruvate formate lyase activating enzyme
MEKMAEKKEAIVFDFGHFRNTDGYGIRTMIFFKGCPLRCKWCSNPFGLSVAPQLAVNRERCVGCGMCVKLCSKGVNRINPDDHKVEMDFDKCKACGLCVQLCPQKCRQISGTKYTAEQLYKKVQRELTFTRRDRGGLTLSGGEVLMQHEIAAELLKICKRDYIDTCIETSAFAKWEHLLEVAQYCDTVFVDMKHIDSDRHKEITGVPNELIMENIRKLCEYMSERGKRVIIRRPFIPGYNDEESCTIGIAKFVATLPRKPEINILPYHNLGELKYKTIGSECEVQGVNMMKKKDEPIVRCAELCRQYAPENRVSVGGEAIEYPD